MKSAKEAKIQAEDNEKALYNQRYKLCIDRLSNLIDQEVKDGQYQLTIGHQWYKEIFEALHYCYSEVKAYLNDKGYSFEKQSSSHRWITSSSDQGSLQEYALSWKDAK